MRKLFIVTLIGSLYAMPGFSQDNERNNILNTMEDMARGKQVSYSRAKTDGSPYINKTFVPAKVSNVSKTALMRYDVYQDEFEFTKGKDTLVLNKGEQYNTITLMGTNTKYKFVEYNKKGNPVTGYLISVYEKNNFELFKKQNIVYVPEKVPTTGFDRAMPASFAREDDTFYLKDSDKGVLEFPTNKKAMLKLYPEKKEALESFIKQNKIDFDKEADLIKLIDFLSA